MAGAPARSAGPRSNALLALSLLACIALMVLVTLTIDRQIYQRDKIDLLQNRYLAAFPIRDRQMLDLARDYLLRAEEGLDRSRQTRRIAQMMRRNLTGDNPIVSIALKHKGELLIVEGREDHKRFNTWSNSLIPRDFRFYGKMRFDDPRSPRRSLGEIEFALTSPLNYPPLERLTTRYRIVLGLILAAILLFYLLLLHFLVLPIRRVTHAIQATRDGGAASFVPQPTMRLEALYNDMAREAALNALGQALEGPRPSPDTPGREGLLRALAPQIVERFAFGRIAAVEMRRPARGDSWHLARTAAAAPDRETLPLGQLVPDIADLAGRLERQADSSLGGCAEALWNGSPVWVGAVAPPDEPDVLYLIVFAEGAAGMSKEWMAETARRIVARIGGLVEREAIRSREMFRERSRANVNLARSMGHDLTNAIAAARLELMTLSQAFQNDTPMDAQARLGAARDAAERLRDNTRALQRIVDLYRAYEYLETPRYEESDLNDIVRETVDIFLMATSSPARIDYDLADAPPLVRAEPRLLTLAIFNLLANAQDALRRQPPAHGEPRILLHTAAGNDMKEALVRVTDNGPGIRNAQDEPAGPDEIARIFDMGYTTREGGQGLGLNWVRSIVAEFHHGTIEARNIAGGGAQMEIRLRSSSKENEQPGS